MMLALVAAFTFVACSEEPADKVALATPSVKVEAVTSEGFTLSWAAVENAASYDVEINGEVNNTTTAGYTATGLTPGQYTVRVKAVAAAGSAYADSEYAVTLVTVELGAGVDWFSQELFLDSIEAEFVHPFNAVFFKWTGEDLKFINFSLFVAAESYNIKDEDLLAGKYDDYMFEADAEFLQTIATEGSIELYFSGLDQNVEYEMIAIVENKAGNRIVERDIISTEVLDNAVFEAWKAGWTGQWTAVCQNTFQWYIEGTVEGTSSIGFQLTEDTQEFTITFQSVAEEPEMMLVFGLSKIFPDYEALAVIDSATGALDVYAGVELGEADADGYVPMWLAFGENEGALIPVKGQFPVYQFNREGDTISSKLYTITLSDETPFHSLHMDIYAVGDPYINVYLGEDDFPANLYAGNIAMTRSSASAQMAAAKSVVFPRHMATGVELRK